MQLTFDSALKKWKNAITFIADYRKKEKLTTAQLESVNQTNVRSKSGEEKQQIYQWIVTNSNWLMANRAEFELATQLAKLSEDQLFSLSEDFPKWAKLFNLGTEQDS